MSDALTFGLGCLVVVLAVIVIMAFRFPAVFASFFGSVESLEIQLSGIKLKRAATAVTEAQKAKNPRAEAQVPTELLQLMAQPPRVLWVDDHPENNRNEQAMLTALGIRVVTALSNGEAIGKARRERPDLVISDIDRDQEGPGAGLQLPSELKAEGLTPDVVYYTGHATSPTTDFGAPVTDMPLDLLAAVVERLAPYVRQDYVRSVVREGHSRSR